ncbi:MAG: hypothetical protein HYZ58_13085 [Acidobacteria bacterium]|nr:hypothetical protein [Acidobacteriota bacterium]MBI3264067.1 hypothetical protein [Acidobacteriota bacterium]
MTQKDWENDRLHGDLVDLLQRIDRGTKVPPVDPAREAALLTAFDAARERPRSLAGRSHWLAIAATLILIGGAAAIWIATGGGFASAPRPDASAIAPASEPDESEFVVWPGASALPPLDNGQLVRMDLPAALLPSLGLFPPASDATVISADVLIGQDGLARAVRLMSITHNEVQQ